MLMQPNLLIISSVKIFPFREAHHIVGEVVLAAIDKGVPLEDLTLTQLQEYSDNYWPRCLSTFINRVDLR